MTKHAVGSVVHVSSAHPYTDNRIHYRECTTLAEAGYNVTLVAVESDVEGPPTDVRVLTIPRRGRVARVTISGFQAVRLALGSGARIVHLHDPELIPYIPLLRMAGRRVVYDAHEDLPVQVMSKPYVNKITRKLLVGIARCLLAGARSANLIVAATEKIALRFRAGRTVLVRNYPRLRTKESQDRPRRNILVYVGGMSRNRGTLEVLEAIADPNFPRDWALHLAGKATAEVLEALEGMKQRAEVVYHGQLAPEAARDLLLEAKVGIVTLSDTAAYRDSLPTKMFEYFAAGLPVIASDFPLWRILVEESDSGIVVNERDPTDIASGVKFYAENPAIREFHSANARRSAVERLNWASEGSVLVDAYADLVGA